MKRMLILMRGVPGSGKSYLARRLAGRLGAKYYSTDELLIARDVYTWTPSLCYAGHQICKQLVELAMRRGERYIVVDNTHLKPSQGRPYVDLARKYGYTVEVREPQTPWRYDLQQLIQRGTHGLAPEAVEHMLETWKNVPLEMFRKVLELHDTGTTGPQPAAPTDIG